MAAHNLAITPVSTPPLAADPPLMQEIRPPLHAAVLQTRSDACTALHLERHGSGQSLATAHSAATTIPPEYSPPFTTSLASSSGRMDPSELRLLRSRYEEHRAQYHRFRRTYVIITVAMAFAAMALVLMAFMLSSPHIVMAIGIILVVVFICMIHRMAVLKDVVKKERQLLNMGEGEEREREQSHDSSHRNFPLPDDQYLVITQSNHGHEHRILISGPPEYDTAAAIPPAYPAKHDRAREMEEAQAN